MILTSHIQRLLMGREELCLVYQPYLERLLLKGISSGKEITPPYILYDCPVHIGYLGGYVIRRKKLKKRANDEYNPCTLIEICDKKKLALLFSKTDLYHVLHGSFRTSENVVMRCLLVSLLIHPGGMHDYQIQSYISKP